MKHQHHPKAFLSVFLLLSLLACQIPTVVGLPFAPPTSTYTSTFTLTATQTATATLTATATATLTATATPTETATATQTPTAVPSTRRVVIISIDGLRPDAILLAPMPNLIGLMQKSAFSLGARTVFPSVTLVAHSSMLTGMCPSKHGVDWNDYLPETDLAGHAYGWLSPEQISTIQRADETLGRLLAELDARNLRDETLIIVTADHGGNGQGHGSDSRKDMTIPWIASGPGIQPKILITLVHTMDTAATAAFALGLEIPYERDGVPVYEAFGLPVAKPSVECR